ncbi:S-type pyocin domain-containing protein [Pseudomonas protegens]|uniref:S-type pyocin domain-containing protein n=1 Tax=Pseudomonas protegens TaxID=380021 RepID=UPI00382E1F3E
MSSTNDYLGPNATQTGPGSYVLPSTTISSTVQPGNYFEKSGGSGGKAPNNYVGSPDGLGVTIKMRQKLNSTFGPLIREAKKELSENYETRRSLVPETIEHEIAAADSNYKANLPKTAKDIEHEILIVETLIKHKATEAQSQTAIANSFYHHEFFAADQTSFFQELIGRWGTAVSTPDESFNEWLKSINAAYTVKLLTEETAHLYKRIAELNAQAETIRVSNTFQLQGSIAVAKPLFTVARGTIAIEGGAAALATAIRSAIVGLVGLVAGAASSAVVGVFAFLTLPRELANGELPERYAFSAPLPDLNPNVDQQMLKNAATTTAMVDISIRISSKTAEDGRSEVFVVKTDGVTVPSKVRVITATYNAERKIYTATTADAPPRTIVWTPAVSPGNSSTSLPAEPTTPSIYNGATITPIEGRIDTLPEEIKNSFDDYILIFPADTGIPPIYLVFSKPPVKSLEVDIYGNFTGRPRAGNHLDHMPAQGALATYLRLNIPGIQEKKIRELMKKGASIAIPARIHQKYSETYGGRNTKEKQRKDAADLRGAVDSNFNAIKSALLEDGFLETDIEFARATLHKINEEQGWY